MMCCQLKLSVGKIWKTISFSLCLSSKFRITYWILMRCLICFSRYQEYKSEYISTQKRAYFNAHKDEEWYWFSFSTAKIYLILELLSCFKYVQSCDPSFIWFIFWCRLKDKYHPTNLLTVIERWVFQILQSNEEWSGASSLCRWIIYQYFYLGGC